MEEAFDYGEDGAGVRRAEDGVEEVHYLEAARGAKRRVRIGWVWVVKVEPKNLRLIFVRRGVAAEEVKDGSESELVKRGEAVQELQHYVAGYCGGYGCVSTIPQAEARETFT